MAQTENTGLFEIKDGILTKYHGRQNNIVIREGVTEIGSAVFADWSRLLGVSIPSGVKKIGYAAFANCRNLTDVSIPETVEIIERKAFSGCDSLTEVSLPDGLERIGASAFAGCKNLPNIDIPKGVKSIESGAFSGCSRITEVRIPASVTDIDSGAFSNCHSLGSIRVEPDNPCYCSDESGVLFNRTMTVLLAAPGALSGSYTIPADVIDIMAWAFSGCSRLQSLSIPDSVKNIDWGALKGIREIRIRDWSHMSTHAVDEKTITAIYTDDLKKVPTELKRVAISGFLLDDDVDRKSDRFRSHRAYLTGHVEKLCPYFFEQPELLYALCEKQLLPAKNVDQFMEEAECRKNTEIKALLLNYQQTLGSEKMEKAREAKEKAKQDYADGLIQRLSERDLSKGIDGMTFVVTGSLRRWENRDEIREWLGQYGASLGGSITRKTDYLVTNDPNSGTEKNMKAKAVGALVISEEEFNHMVGWHYQDEETVTVPEWLTSIPDGAFLGNKNTKTVAIPESITRIGTGAFAYCESLEKVNIPKSVRWIDRFAFRGCKGLADQNGFVVIRGVLYDYFGNDRAAVIPDGVVRIQKGAFHHHSERKLYLPVRGVSFGADSGIYKDSSKLERVVIPDSVRWIEEGAFLGCKGIKAVIMAEGVAIMGESAFAGCSALLEISIPGSVKSIGERAFSDCTGLETIVISEGVEKLEKEAFFGCSNLKTVDLPASIAAFESNALPNDHVFTVRTVKDSHAMKYAKRRKLKVELME